MISTKKNRFSFAALAVAAITVAPNVEAAVIATSPVWADSGQSYHACNVVNISTATVSVTVELINSVGTVVTGPTTVSLLAGHSIELPGSSSSDPSGFEWCRFTASSVTSLRGNISVFRYMGSYYDTLAMSEAK
ncbi:hypothetical protein THII_3236 [Thioploca ingrica]|uniref:Secreted protein n=1 Tax=Thioploca ingrica TaxID=40754 RepID=A0A090AGX5_9GAMM|nr:hypothetical protein THII_3236 [Thioploca ingrica]